MKRFEVAERITDFKKRINEDGRDFCLELFEWAEVRLLAHKYAYYVQSAPYIDDYTYDLEEESWRIMGQALGLLDAETTSPCVDFDWNHRFAKEAEKLALKYSKKKRVGNGALV